MPRPLGIASSNTVYALATGGANYYYYSPETLVKGIVYQFRPGTTTLHVFHRNGKVTPQEAADNIIRMASDMLSYPARVGRNSSDPEYVRITGHLLHAINTTIA